MKVVTAPAPHDGKTGHPVLDGMDPAQRATTLSFAESQQREQQTTARATLEPRIRDATQAYLTTGEFTGTPITRADFAKAYAPEQAEEKWTAFEAPRQGVEALRLRFRGAILEMMKPADPTISRDAQAIQKEGRLRVVEQTYRDGVIRNLGNGYGYGMVDATSGLAVAGPDGKPLVFTLDDVLAAAKRKKDGPVPQPEVTIDFPGMGG